MNAVEHYGVDVGPRPINRFDRLRLEPDRYRTFQIAAPRATHWRRASCEEVECERYATGWIVDIEALTEQQRQHVLASRYQFRETDWDGKRVWHFAAGQPCFEGHQVPVGRPALYLVRNGDWRASEIVHEHRTPEAWRDDCAEHQDRWATIAGRG